MESFRLTSYNTLADAYASKRLYAAVDPAHLHWSRRGPHVVDRIAMLQPGIACLQEVQASHWPAMQSAFAELGWQSCYARKGQSRLDGCAILYRGEQVRLAHTETLYFDDGEGGAPPSGHLALMAWFETPVGLVRVATTHLRWQAPTDRPELHIGYREGVQLLERCTAPEDGLAGTVICGDFNVSAESAVAGLFARSGFTDAYAARPQGTCNPNGHVSRIDYIFTCAQLEANAEAIPTLSEETVLPNAEEPSDHLPITAELRLRDKG